MGSAGCSSSAARNSPSAVGSSPGLSAFPIRLPLLPADVRSLDPRGGSSHGSAEGQRRVGWVAEAFRDHGGPQGQHRRPADLQRHDASQAGSRCPRNGAAPAGVGSRHLHVTCPPSPAFPCSGVFVVSEAETTAIRTSLRPWRRVCCRGRTAPAVPGRDRHRTGAGVCPHHRCLEAAAAATAQAASGPAPGRRKLAGMTRATCAAGAWCYLLAVR